IGRLLDMGIEPYVLRSGVLAVVFQRLVRRLCDCARPASSTEELMDLSVESARVAVGCPQCSGTGYSGRTLLAEMLTLDSAALGAGVWAKGDGAALEGLAGAGGMVDRWRRAADLVALGVTSPAEVRRVLGFARKTDPPAGI